ncbi:MAG: hypothetical protein Q3968_03320 [Clostridiaceae bacterium]|nr:hypothetical protein [Clostridiaceae bacterium]
MRTSKKILSVVMALMMLLSVIALSAYAIPADTVAEATITADKATYAAGDEIVLTIYCQTNAEAAAVKADSQIILGYDSTGIEPYSTSADLLDHGFAVADNFTAAFDNSMSQAVDNNTLLGMGTTISDGDAIIGYFVSAPGGDFAPSVDAPVALFTVKMRVKADAPDGDYTIAFNKDSFADYNCYVVDEFASGLYGESGPDFGFAATNMWSLGSVTIHVGATGPEVNYVKTQLKKNSGGYDVQMRITSVITDSDFDTYFPNTTTHGTDPAPTANALTSVGIVAFHGAEADFDEAAAKALVIDGTAATGYEAAETDYISKASDTADGYFGAILRGSRAAFENLPVTFMGYARYLDSTGTEQVIFYPAAVEKTITTAQLNA